MEYYYIIANFYPDLENPNEFEEALIPYHTFEEACNAVDKTMDLYESHNEDNAYECFWIPDIRTTVGFIYIKDDNINRAFRFEIVKGNLGIIKTK